MTAYKEETRHHRMSWYCLNRIQNQNIKEIQVDILWWLVVQVIRWICLLLFLHHSYHQYLLLSGLIGQVELVVFIY